MDSSLPYPPFYCNNSVAIIQLPSRITNVTIPQCGCTGSVPIPPTIAHPHLLPVIPHLPHPTFFYTGRVDILGWPCPAVLPATCCPSFAMDSVPQVEPLDPVPRLPAHRAWPWVAALGILRLCTWSAILSSHRSPSLACHTPAAPHHA